MAVKYSLRGTLLLNPMGLSIDVGDGPRLDASPSPLYRTQMTVWSFMPSLNLNSQ